MLSSKTTLVALTIGGNMFLMFVAKLLDSLLDDFIASLVPHRLGATMTFVQKILAT